jgi:hypothetical protein
LWNYKKRLGVVVSSPLVGIDSLLASAELKGKYEERRRIIGLMQMQRAVILDITPEHVFGAVSDAQIEQWSGIITSLIELIEGEHDPLG